MSRSLILSGDHPASESISRALLRHFRALMGLAWPVMLSRAGILLMALVDIAMLGRFGPGAPGIAGLGLALFMPAIVISIGLVSGMVPVIAQAWGAGERAEAGRAWRRAMVWACLVSAIGTLLVWWSGNLLQFFDYPAETAAGASEVARALAPGLAAQVLYTACAFYLESTQRPIYALFAMVVANIVNFGLNWVMIFGHLGWPEMGATGAALATTMARFVAFAVVLWVILAQKDPHGAGVRGPWGSIWGPGGWEAGRMMRRLGIAAGISTGFETFAFASMVVMAGTLGATALDAYSVSHNLISTTFMVGLGLSVATGVRVAQAAGAGERREAALAGWTGLLTAGLLMGVLCAFVLLFRQEIAFAYSDVPEIIARTTTLFLFSALVFVPDSMQVVMGQAVRALGDAWVPVGIYISSFLFLMVPLGRWMIGPGGWDERGLVIAIIISCVLAGVLLSWRFHRLTRDTGDAGP
ncbi:MAG TPA: MATE family efflux transporter [Paracoccaceae bacterium]|nr:MATE family efflux transporter [Paracoccaceae bacterium]